MADELFYREGVRALGVNTIIAQSEVAKTTLYLMMLMTGAKISFLCGEGAARFE